MRRGFLNNNQPSTKDQGPLRDERSSRQTWAEWANARQPGGVVLDPPPQPQSSSSSGWGTKRVTPVPSTVHTPINPNKSGGRTSLSQGWAKSSVVTGDGGNNYRTHKDLDKPTLFEFENNSDSLEDSMALDMPDTNPTIDNPPVLSAESTKPIAYLYPPATNTEGVPKNAFFEFYKQQQRLMFGKQHEVAKPTYITWKKGAAHLPQFRSVMVHPHTGECFESGRYGLEKYHQVEETQDGSKLVWYTKKSYAEHGAAALAYDCLTYRETLAGGKHYQQLGHDPPYKEPRPLALSHIPDSEVKRIAIAKREAIQRGKEAQEISELEKEAAWMAHPDEPTKDCHEAQPMEEEQTDHLQFMNVKTPMEKEAAFLEQIASTDKIIHYDHPAISKDNPISALNAYFQRTYKTNTGMKDFFITWDNGLKFPELRFTSIFVNPWSGEIFPSTRYDAVQGIIDDGNFTWFLEKVESRHGAAARAYDCLAFRESLKNGETYELIGTHPPHAEDQHGIDETKVPASTWQKVQKVVQVAKTSYAYPEPVSKELKLVQIAETNACPEPILQELNRRLGAKPIDVQSARSAQQCVWIVQYDPAHAFSGLDGTWHDALECGRNHLVIRLWKGGSRWWNLNRPTSPHLVARSELAGYQAAYKALPQRIPRVLTFFGSDSVVSGEELSSSWAILEYVGPRAKRYSGEDHGRHHDSYWITSMVKIREEFGFAEPHPRWGRVPVDKALQYACLVLKDVIVPIHKWFLGQQQTDSQRNQFSSILDDHIVEGLTLDLSASELKNKKNPFEKPGHSYWSMLELYKQAHSDMQMILNRRKRNNDDDYDARLGQSFDLLEKCIKVLRQQSSQAFLQPLPFVLVHMDCQPQNLMIAKEIESKWHISAVLDWEEAALADPRFELLLLGRKVCADMDQAKALWEYYQDEMAGFVQLGPMEPWLRLETVHSLTTLLLQAMNQGGRSPWEKKPDLYGKIHREFQRLAVVPGWEFCEDSIP